MREDALLTTVDIENGKNTSEWVVMAASAEDLGPKLRTAPWRPTDARGTRRAWTDDQSSIVPLFR